jgi:hypothetical protein
MIARRELLIGGGALAVLPGLLHPGAARAAPPPPPPPGDRLGFDILRKGSLLGHHLLTFATAADRLTVKVEVSLLYKLLGITLFHYNHHCTEVWEGGQVVALDSRTDDNGSPSQLTARRAAAGLVVEATGTPRYTAPANALPATHWNQHELDGPWINTENGKLLRPHVTPAGTETIPAAGGRSLIARQFDLSGDVQLAMWYDRIGWAGLAFTRGGAPIRYERQA